MSTVIPPDGPPPATTVTLPVLRSEIASQDTKDLKNDAFKEKQASAHSVDAQVDKLWSDVRRFRRWQLFVAYSVMAVSITCTLGTAFIGIAASVLAFNDQPLASKAVSLLLAFFGVILSLLKGISQPGTAFTNLTDANHIIDHIKDYKDHDGGVTYEEIKTLWRTLRDKDIAMRANVFKSFQK